MVPYLNLERFITHSVSLDNIKEGMETVKSKEGLKVIVNFNK